MALELTKYLADEEEVEVWKIAARSVYFLVEPLEVTAAYEYPRVGTLLFLKPAIQKI